MIAFIKGNLVDKSPTEVVVENQGIGYNLNLSVSSFEKLGEIGSEVKLFTHLHVREDILKLYGFISTNERSLFRLLISVSGIGPKVALGILSGLTVEEFKQAVLSHDVVKLKSAPGVGKKTAERLALELKDKINKIAGDLPLNQYGHITSVEEEAVLALTSLGYKLPRAEEAVRQSRQTDPGLSVEELIRAALRGM